MRTCLYTLAAGQLPIMPHVSDADQFRTGDPITLETPTATHYRGQCVNHAAIDIFQNANISRISYHWIRCC